MISTDDVITFENGKYGRRAILRGPWSDQIIGYLAGNNVVELELNQGKGWAGTDIRFLAELPGLKSFEICDFNIQDIEPIHSLRKLKRLGVTTYCSTGIDFGIFPNVKAVA